MSAENWSVYLILCENGAFYCGISNRPQERFAAHLSGKGAKYTRLNKPVEMRIVSDGLTKSEALKREIGGACGLKLKPWQKANGIGLNRSRNMKNSINK